MITKFSKDIVLFSTIKVNPGKIVKRVNQTHRPILSTSRGCRITVVQSLDDCEGHEEERAFKNALVQGLLEVENGKFLNLGDAKRKLGIN